jgi:hypothetical protein
MMSYIVEKLVDQNISSTIATFRVPKGCVGNPAIIQVDCPSSSFSVSLFTAVFWTNANVSAQASLFPITVTPLSSNLLGNTGSSMALIPAVGDFLRYSFSGGSSSPLRIVIAFSRGSE